jgi:hypothetical protein
MVLYDDTTTAAREEGKFKFYVSGASGAKIKVNEMTSFQAGASGQGSTPSEWNVLPEGKHYAPGGGKLWIGFIPKAADTLDTTDCLFYQLPVTVYY